MSSRHGREQLPNIRVTACVDEESLSSFFFLLSSFFFLLSSFFFLFKFCLVELDVALSIKKIG
ncbi:hypothetical protein ABZR34_17445 [Pseudomonas paraeruginosa]|uniref:hypothetical protein n=1 Tax=Pseudomonas paraeruginosa TaxID=2994495 RepID=UPI00345AB475